MELNHGEDERLIGIAEASRMLGVHPNTLRRWEKEGRVLPGRLPGGQRRYRVADIEALTAGDPPAAPAFSSATARQAAS